jgi:hypothetical protein
VPEVTSSSDTDEDENGGLGQPPIDPSHVVRHICFSSISDGSSGRTIGRPVTAFDLLPPWCHDSSPMKDSLTKFITIHNNL